MTLGGGGDGGMRQLKCTWGYAEDKAKVNARNYDAY